ncbi:MAG: exo-alpha-sialidase [Planctomycetes bacterium]|nr:exo-alpha-sialidase [Planctomycetota bacterium]
MSENKRSNGESLPEVQWIGDINCDDVASDLPTLQNVERTIVYRATPETGSYSHHGYIILHNNTLFATWSNHAKDEDAPGQRVLWSRSTDEGKTWASWEELFPPRDEVKSGDEQDHKNDRILIANGFGVADGELYAVAEVHVLENRRGIGRLARRTSPDGSVGPIFWVHDDPPEPLNDRPAYPDATDPEFTDKAQKVSEWLARPQNWPSWEFLNHQSRPKAADGHQMCEPTQAWQLEDGTYVRLYRDLGDPRSGMNYAQFSFDDGSTWTKPVQTNFPDACSRSAAGQLPDGTAYVINNPGHGRDPLVISLAEDGLTFDQHAVIVANAPPKRYEGRWKGIGFQYPRATVADDNLFVIYSINKEDVEIARIPLDELEEPSGP